MIILNGRSARQTQHVGDSEVTVIKTNSEFSGLLYSNHQASYIKQMHVQNSNEVTNIFK